MLSYISLVTPLTSFHTVTNTGLSILSFSFSVIRNAYNTAGLTEIHFQACHMHTHVTADCLLAYSYLSCIFEVHVGWALVRGC